jgi:hypothetical protein
MNCNKFVRCDRMNKKIGRNDPCPCGSGKKYKKCCLISMSCTAEVSDFEWYKLRQLEGRIFDRHLIPYAIQELPDDVIEFAIHDCIPDNLPNALNKELLFNNFFLPWFLFNWIPYENFGLNHNQFNPELTLAQNYIKAHGYKLNKEEKRFIEVMNQSYYSFYSVLQVELNRSLLIKDILLGLTHTIKERQGTHQLKRGDIIFSRILTIGDQSIFIGMAPFIVPTDYHNVLLDFKEWLIEENDKHDLTPEALHYDFDITLLDYFFEIMGSAYNRPSPTLVNTDGDLLQFSRTYFKLAMTPEEALNRLLPMTLSDDSKQFLRDAKYTKTGEIKHIEFSWLKKGNKRHKSWDNTILGHISIEQGRLILETNSERRTQNGKKLLTKYLGKAISFQQTLIESPEKKLQSIPRSKLDNKSKSDHLMALPEVKEQIKAMAKQHWQNWFNDPIPALDNQTPRQAAKTEKGRERLEALLLQYERHDLEIGDHPFKTDITYLKSELGLDFGN